MNSTTRRRRTNKTIDGQELVGKRTGQQKGSVGDVDASKNNIADFFNHQPILIFAGTLRSSEAAGEANEFEP